MADKSPLPALWLKEARGSTSRHGAGLGGKQPDSGVTPPGSSLMTGDRKATGKAGPRRLAASGPSGDRTVTPPPAQPWVRRELGADAMPLSPSAVSYRMFCEKNLHVDLTTGKAEGGWLPRRPWERRPETPVHLLCPKP